MKILEKRTPKTNKWWINDPKRCCNCDSLFEIEEDDLVQEISGIEGFSIDVKCPVCSELNTILKPK